MSNKIKVGIIGAGAIGSVHANAYTKVENAEVVALCDILPDKLKAKAAQHNIGKTYATAAELLADPEIQAVDVCVPNFEHAPIAIQAFQAGKHVMLEKPMALNAQQGLEILKARDAAGKILQMGMVRRQSPNSEILREEIAAGRLGEIYQINVKQIRRRGIPGMGGWFTTKAQSGGGALIDIAVHSFDLALWTTNYWNPTRVSARAYSKFGSPMKDYKYVSMWAGPPNYDGVFDVDDYVTGLVRFDTRATMTFQVSWAANSEDGNFMEILGDKGGAVFDFSNNLKFFTEVNGRIANVEPQFKKEGVDIFAKELTKFIAAINGEGEVPATGEQGVIDMKLLDAVYRSSLLNQEVEV